MKSRVHAISAVLLLMTMTSPAFPQADVSTATLKGTVSDQAKAVIVGATVTATSVDRGTTRVAKTDQEGKYQIPLLQPGSYEVRVEATGFETRVIGKLELTIGQIVVVDPLLSAGGLATEVSVTTDAPLIEVERTQQANTINKLQVESLPNVGRGFTAYIFTLPGVNSSDAPRVQNPGFTFGSSGFSIGGSNGRNNLVTLDGGENEYGSGQLRTNISIEAVQEFQVNRNAFAAEFGFTAGTAVNVISKGGRNDFHGSGYVYYRSQKTNARDFFDFGPKKAFDQQVYPGFTLGGPISRNRSFFFTSFETLKSDIARFRRYTDNPAVLGPTAAQAAYLSTLAGTSNPTLQRVAAELRARLTTTNFPTTLNLLRSNEGTFVAPDRLRSWTTKLDYQISNNDSLSGRFSLTDNDTSGLGAGNAQAPNSANALDFEDYTAVATWSHNFNATVVNQARVQLVPNNSAKTTPAEPDSTSLLISGIAGFGRTFAAPFNTFQDRYQFEDNLSWLRGKHGLKFGASYRPVNYRVINELWFGGEWQFNSGVFPLILAVQPADRAAIVGFNRSRGIADNGPALANFSAIQSFNFGLPFLFRQGFGNAEWQDWAHYLGAFAQDSWKVTPKLTLDIGLRYDYDAEPAPLQKKGYFSPRFGFAWDPLGDQKTVIRGGAGVFYSPVYYQVAYVTNLLNDSGQFINQVFKSPADLAAQQPAAIWAAGVTRGKLPFTALTESDIASLGIQTGPRNPGRVLFEADPNYKNNYSIQASFGISREIVNNLSMELAYQTYRGVHIQLPHEVNYRESGVVNPQLGPQFVRINPAITQKNVYKSVGNSIYHGLTASLRKRYSNNFQLEAHYTWSKAIDDQTDFNSAFAAFIPTRLDLDRAISAFDVPHVFTANAVIKTPFQGGSGHNLLARAFADITLAPIVFIRSGIPFTLRIGRDINGDTHSTYDRPFLASRNTGRGDNFASLNLRFNKVFHISRDSGTRLEFVVDASNLLNHTNFTSVNDVIGTDNPALLAGPFNLRGTKNLPRTSPLAFDSAAAGRQIQFGLKLGF